MQTRPVRDRRPLLIAAVFAVMFVFGLVAWPSVHAQICPSIIVASSNEKFDLMKSLAKDYSTAHTGWSGCGPAVQVERVASGDAERKLAEGWSGEDQPDVWSPAAYTWVQLLRAYRTDLVPEADGRPPSIASSPLVVAVPETMATAMSWQQDPPTWNQLFTFARDPGFWAGHGHAEWGAFRLGKTDPGKSTSGIHSLIAEYFAAVGKSDLTATDLDRPSSRAYVAEVEAGFSHYAPTVGSFLDNLAKKDDPSPYISALAVEEQEVFHYNEGGHSDGQPPDIPLVPLYPPSGTLDADHPYVVLRAQWVTEAKRKTALAFMQWLQERKQQARFDREGFRDSGGNAGETLGSKEYIIKKKPSVLPLPSPAVIAKIQASWKEFRKSARILIVLALSDAPQREYVRAGVKGLSDNDEVAIWPLARGRSFSPLDLTRLAGGRDTVLEAIGSAPTGSGEVPLYQTIAYAYRFLKPHSDPARINAIVVIAANSDNGFGPTLTDLRREVHAALTGAPIRIYTVALKGSDPDALLAIEKSSGGVDSSSGNPADAIRTALANF
jgi:Ca-activated chloride channel homolog